MSIKQTLSAWIYFELGIGLENPEGPEPPYNHKEKSNNMKQLNTITIQFWLVRPEGDHHTPEQMRDLGEAGIFEPVFTSGQKMLLNMTARFDIHDSNARISAALYAMRNAKHIIKQDHPGSHIFGPQIWINGEKTPSSLETQSI